MENENDQLPVEIEAQLELDLKPELKHGWPAFAELNVRRTCAVPSFASSA